MIDKHITDFNENLIGLRDFVELIEPFLNEKIEENDKHIRPLVLSAIIEDTLKNNNELEEDEKEKYIEYQAKVKKDLADIYTEIPEVKINREDKDKDESFSITIAASNKEVSKHMKNVEKNHSHIELLYTNSLISSLSSVEWFFSQLLHFFYNEHPDSAGVQKRTLTLSDLKVFGSIEEAEKHLIDTKIDEILRGNFESWIILMKTELKLGLGYLDEMLDELTEIYQRRNLFVHNGGIVNSIYLAKVKSQYRENIENGQKLKVTKDYLDKTICKLQKAFILIGAELWKKLAPEDASRGNILGDIVYENVLHSRWEICEGLCYFIMKDALTSPVDKVIAQINFWLAKKATGNYSSIKKEIDKIDYSDKKEIFQLGLYALRGETEKLIEILPIVLETNQTNIERLEEFPILKEFRETPEYKRFKENSKFFKEENQEVEKLVSVEKG